MAKAATARQYQCGVEDYKGSDNKFTGKIVKVTVERKGEAGVPEGRRLSGQQVAGTGGVVGAPRDELFTTKEGKSSWQRKRIRVRKHPARRTLIRASRTS